MPKSCYVLELSVIPSGIPGGARRGDLFTYNRLAHIRRCLEQEFLGADAEGRAYAASLAAGQHETIALWIVEGGRLARSVDLRRHVRLRVDGDPALSLAEANARDEVWRARLADGAGLAFEIDWDTIAAETPPLRGEPLRPGESLDLDVDEDVVAAFDSYLEITEELRYGFEDLEGGEAAPPGFVDPDPPG